MIAYRKLIEGKELQNHWEIMKTVREVETVVLEYGYGTVKDKEVFTWPTKSCSFILSNLQTSAVAREQLWQCMQAEIVKQFPHNP